MIKPWALPHGHILKCIPLALKRAEKYANIIYSALISNPNWPQ